MPKFQSQLRKIKAHHVRSFCIFVSFFRSSTPLLLIIAHLPRFLHGANHRPPGRSYCTRWNPPRQVHQQDRHPHLLTSLQCSLPPPLEAAPSSFKVRTTLARRSHGRGECASLPTTRVPLRRPTRVLLHPLPPCPRHNDRLFCIWEKWLPYLQSCARRLGPTRLCPRRSKPTSPGSGIMPFRTPSVIRNMEYHLCFLADTPATQSPEQWDILQGSCGLFLASVYTLRGTRRGRS